jgi:hypothetical protein
MPFLHNIKLHIEKPGKLHKKMMEYRKKNKLEIGTVTVEDVEDIK